VVQQLSLETSLRRALERSELDVYYQPTVELKTGTIIGAEALVRWRHPQLGMVPPERFIPLAEETGLIVSIGEWVLNRACDDCVSWHQAGFDTLRVAVNLSPRQLQGDLVPIVGRALRRSGLRGEQLEFELTESLLMGDSIATMDELRQLKETAVRFSIDDFGTGYSSLSYLKRFPFDTLKIDRSFVSDLAEDTDDAAIASAIVAMAHRLGLSVTAEGVETRDQLRFLQRQGCDAVQGYFFSEPIPCADFAALLRRGLDRSAG
jgi:EAL domain-containing protein (putative c-di-GMP-specific phosphodiesterase class I)